MPAKPAGAKRAEMHLWYATLTVTLASGVMSTIGVYEVLGANRAYGFSLSLLVGVVITAMLSGAWSYLFHALPQARGATLVNLSLLLVPFLVLVFLISSWTNATAVVGGPALNMHNRQFLNDYGRALDAANRQVQASAPTLAAMRAEASAFRADVAGEIADGRLTGYSGRGVVSGTLEQIADKLDGMVAEAQTATEAAAQTSAEASAAFAEVQSHLEQGKNDPAFVKERFDRIHHAIIELDEKSPAAVMAALLPAIHKGIAFRGADGRSAGLRDRQAEALEGSVVPRVEQTFATLEDLARSTAGGTVELPRFEHLSAPEAAMRYMAQFPIYWGMAIAIDLMPLFFLVLLVVATPRVEPGFELTAGELHQAMAVYSDLRHLVEGLDNVTLLPRGRQMRQ